MILAALALKLRTPPWRLHEIVRGNRLITPETALRLARYFGNEPQFWPNLRV
jgi:antitoxin HigA-1